MTDRAQLAELRREMRRQADARTAAFMPSFFKTGKGEYGEGDVFIGLTMPQSRAIAKEFRTLDEPAVTSMLASKVHEERTIALLILVERFEKGDAATRAAIVKFYLGHLSAVNNWDLVDMSAAQILGASLVGGSKAILHRFARSKDLWTRRVAIVATFAFIRQGEIEETFHVAELLLNDEHDLIHKATGWMLREAGKRDKKSLVDWLAPRYKTMPRTMLRYAIEKFSDEERRRYLQGLA